MALFRVVGGSHARVENGELRVYNNGDLIELPEGQEASGRFQPAGATVPAPPAAEFKTTDGGDKPAGTEDESGAAPAPRPRTRSGRAKR
jgi:hypothetical protein